MFDMSKMGDMMKIANDAKAMQKEQDMARREQTDLLKKISQQLETVVTILESNNCRA